MPSPRQLVGKTEEGDGGGGLDEVVIPRRNGVTQLDLGMETDL